MNRIVVDFDRCSGHGRCYDLAPELFRDDERGYGSVIGDGDIAPEQLSDAEAAVRACPEQAITIVHTPEGLLPR